MVHVGTLQPIHGNISHQYYQNIISIFSKTLRGGPLANPTCGLDTMVEISGRWHWSRERVRETVTNSSLVLSDAGIRWPPAPRNHCTQLFSPKRQWTTSRPSFSPARSQAVAEQIRQRLKGTARQWKTTPIPLKKRVRKATNPKSALTSVLARLLCPDYLFNCL